jgi:hypothetical protein
VTSIVQPLDQGVIATFKMCYKHKLVAWTLQQIDNNSNKHFGKLNIDLFHAMLWCVVAWHELDDQPLEIVGESPPYCMQSGMQISTILMNA